VALASALVMAGVVLAGSLGLGGCAASPGDGYSFAPSYRTDISTVNVQIFQNRTYTRGMEVELASALAAEIRRATPWAVTNSNAQTVLTGTIVGSDMRRLSAGRDSGLIEELAVVVTVDFEWRDARSGKVLASRRGFAASEAFSPAQRVGERVEVGQTAAVARLARDIVAELRSGW
jgi:hypothetical protein